MKVDLNLDELARMIRDAANGQGEHYIAACASEAIERVGVTPAMDEQIRDTLLMHGRFLGVLDG